MFLDLLTGILTTTIVAGGVLALAALGEVLTERVGVVNLGVEGLMSIGAITAVIATTVVPDPTVAFLAAIVVGMVFAALFAAAVVLARANQVLCGLALTMLGSGLAVTVGKAYSGMPTKATFQPMPVPGLSEIPVIGPAFFAQSPVVYLIYVVLPLAISVLMFRTRHGITIRAVGENAAAADAAGLPVARIRFLYTTIGGAFAAAGGAYLTLAFVTSWSDGIVAGRGWIAVSLVIFAGYRPWAAVGGALLFGLITSVGYVGQARNWPVTPALLSTLPYLGTIAFIILPVVLFKRMQTVMAAPAALGIPFFRQER